MSDIIDGAVTRIEANLYMLPEHMRESVRDYLVLGHPVGSFLEALFSNDLMETIGKADHTNKHMLPVYAAFLYSFAPSGSFGSKETHKAWMARGGLKGKSSE